MSREREREKESELGVNLMVLFRREKIPYSLFPGKIYIFNDTVEI